MTNRPINNPSVLSDYLELVYDTSLGNEGWLTLLKRLNRDYPGTRFSLNESSWKLGTQNNLVEPDFDEKLQHLYMTEMLTKDRNPLFDNINVPFDTLFLSEDFMSRDEMKKSAVYNEIFAKFEVEQLMMTPLLRKNHVNSMFIAMYDADIDGIQEDLSQAFTLLLPHLKRAMKLREHVAEKEEQHHHTTTILDRLGSGIVLVDENCRATFYNKVADRIFDRNDGLMLDRTGRLMARHAGLTRQLHEEVFKLSKVLRGNTDKLFTTPHHDAMRIPRTADAGGNPQHYTVLLSGKPAYQPIRSIHQNLQGVVMLTINDPSSAPVVEAKILKTLFSMTKAESDVLNKLLTGASSAEIAEQRGSSVRTVQNQIDSIKDKTGTRDKASAMARVIKEIS